MKIKLLQLAVLMMGLTTVADSFAAADSYRFLHVTIETPWAIFIFLLGFILTPFVLMAGLYWYFAYKKGKAQANERTQHLTDEALSQESMAEKTPD
jgi:hypothetical protein